MREQVQPLPADNNQWQATTTSQALLQPHPLPDPPGNPTIVYTILMSKANHQFLPKVLWPKPHHLTVGLLCRDRAKSVSHSGPFAPTAFVGHFQTCTMRVNSSFQVECSVVYDIIGHLPLLSAWSCRSRDHFITLCYWASVQMEMFQISQGREARAYYLTMGASIAGRCLHHFLSSTLNATAGI